MKNLNQEKVCYIQSGWHQNIVNNLKESCIETLLDAGIIESNIDFVEVPGALEIPLQAKLRAETGKYSIIIVAGLIESKSIIFTAGRESHPTPKSYKLKSIPALTMHIYPPCYS